MDYLMIRTVHVTCACTSIALFMLRVGLTLAGKEWRRNLWLKVLPHINDTLLLIAALYLAFASHQYPFQSDWLNAKLCALLLYILLGKQALKAEQSRSRAMLFSLGALMSVAYIVSVALTRSPTPFL